MLSTPFGQIVTAMVTPFNAAGQIDDTAVVRLVNYLLDQGSDGIVVAGTTGESPTLSHTEKLHLFRLVRDAVGGRAKVLAGSSNYDTAESITLTREAAALGMDGALLVVPPYSRPSQEGLYRHFRAIAEAAPELPCMLYNIPGRTAQNMEADTTVRLAQDVPNIVAIKEASGNLMQCAEIVRRAPAGFALYSGDDGITLPVLAIGGVGVVSVVSHLLGRDLKAMHTAFFNGQPAEAARLHGRMLPVVRALFQPGTPSPVPLKAALNMLGLNVGAPRLPLVEATEAERTVVRNALTGYGLL